MSPPLVHPVLCPKTRLFRSVANPLLGRRPCSINFTLWWTAVLYIDIMIKCLCTYFFPLFDKLSLTSKASIQKRPGPYVCHKARDCSMFTIVPLCSASDIQITWPHDKDSEDCDFLTGFVCVAQWGLSEHLKSTNCLLVQWNGETREKCTEYNLNEVTYFFKYTSMATWCLILLCE